MYKDGFAITAVVNFETLQEMFEALNYSRVTNNSLNISLEETSQAVFAKIKKIVAERDRKQVVVKSFDKWTSQDNTKYFGVYLYVSILSISLGLVLHTCSFGADEISVKLKNILALYDLLPSDYPG